MPTKNNVHEFKLHILEKILDDTGLILTSLGYDLLTKPTKAEDIWYCSAKKTEAKAQFRGDKFVILEGSLIDKTTAPNWGTRWPKALAERQEILEKFGKDNGDNICLIDNVAFKSPNHAGGFAIGNNVNAWTTWKNKYGLTMDEVMRKGLK